jgi:hypothetical protein
LKPVLVADVPADLNVVAVSSPLIAPPAFWSAVAARACMKAVVAIWVVLTVDAAVGAVGVPVSVGEAMYARVRLKSTISTHEGEVAPLSVAY